VFSPPAVSPLTVFSLPNALPPFVARAPPRCLLPAWFKLRSETPRKWWWWWWTHFCVTQARLHR
jgi:hypothetical protein